MKRFSKILALALLLAVAVTAFGVFSAFAEDTATTNRTIHYDMDDSSKWQTPLNSSTDTLKQTDDGYWKLTINSGSKQAYIKNMGQLDSTGAQISDYTVATSEFKYLVYDFDISSDSTLTDGLYFLPTFNTKPEAFQFKINAETYDEESERHISIGNNVDGSIEYGADIDIGSNKWVGVTFVLDFNDLANGNVTYYVYINGTYAGAKLVEGLSLSTYKYLRVYTAGAATKDSSINFANFNISYFANDSLSGQTLGENTTLSADGELAYCLESPNDACVEHVDENADDYCDNCGVYVGPMASIGDVKYYNIEDLQAAIENNVTVTIYEDIDDVIFYPKDATNITFQDKNGVEIGEDGCAVTANLYEVNTAECDWAVVANGAVTLGTTTDENTYVGTDGTVSDALHATLASNKAKNLRVVLFDDVTMYGVVSTRLQFTETLTINLNGYTLDVDNYSANRNVFEPQEGSSISFYHGALEYASVNSSKLYLVGTNSAPSSFFYDCTITADNLFLSQRGGTVTFDGCEITANAILASLTTKTGMHSELTVNGCTITGDTAFKTADDDISGLFAMGPQSSNGGVTYSATIENTTIDVPGNIIFHEMRSTGATSETNAFDINIVNSDIKSSKGSIFAEKPNWKEASATDLVMKDTITLNLKGSTLHAYHYIYSRVVIGSNYIPDNTDYYKSVEYNFTVNADATSKIYARKALANKVYNREDKDPETGDTIGYTPIEHDCVVIKFNLVEGVVVKYTNVSTDCKTTAPVVNIPDNCLFAYTGLHDGYNKIVTSNYTTHQYQIGNAAPVDFLWNAGEEVDVTIVKLPSTSVYTYKLSELPGDNGIYTATLIPNFTPSVSMSTDGTLSLNFFIPEDVYTALKEAGGLNISSAYDYFEENGADLSQYGKGGAFAQFKVIGIDPANATGTVISVAFTIADDNGLSYEKTLEVSVLSYAQSVINNGNDTEKQYAVQLLNYVQAVMAYTGKNDDAAAIGEVITASGLTVNTGEDVIGDAVNDENSATGVTEAEMNLGGSINWVITVEGNATYTVSYTRDGEVTSVERTAKDGKIVISLRAYDVLNNVTITNNSDDTSVTFNLADYYAGQGENAKAVLNALAAYAAEAANYKAILDAASSN